MRRSPPTLPWDAVGIDARPGETVSLPLLIATSPAVMPALAGGFIPLFHADLQTGPQRMGVFAGVRSDLAAGVLVERRPPLALALMPRFQLSLCCSFLADSSRMPPVFRLERGGRRDFGAL